MIREKAQNELPIYLFHQGIYFHAQDYFGCHYTQSSGRAVFRTWAPNALEVSVVGDWNYWTDSVHPMRRISDGGIWETEAYGVQLLQKYKFSILGQDQVRRLKADPFAFYAETDDKTACIVYDISGYDWQDGDWMRRRRSRDMKDQPVNIYEFHVGSWRRRPDGNPYSYTELADQLIPYLKEMGYTHLELLPVMEHTNSRSLGYRICGYYAATSRYGTPHGLMTFIDRCHQAGIGVILDWAPSHIPADANGLAEFDGKAVYEVREDHRGEQRAWESLHFDFGREEVWSFLISNALFWLSVYHADGLCVESLSDILYPDHDQKQSDWSPNAYNGNENAKAVAFLQRLNRTVAELCPGAMMIAEESSAWPMVTKSANDGGLGFLFMWNTGWINDMRDYVSVDPLFRKMIHDKITLSVYYSFSESFILPLSHGEAVQGKRTLIEKMPGAYEWKFAGVRAFLGYMMAHPGKKLTFMGCEIGQFNEWDYASQAEWFLLEFPAHRQLNDYVKSLNKFYLETPALWEIDGSWDGFQWICADDITQNIAIFIRRDKQDKPLIVVQNFAPVTRKNYRFGVPEEGIYEEVFNSDDKAFGGWGHTNKPLHAEETYMHGFPYSLRITIPPLSTVFFRRVDYGNTGV